MKKVLIATHSDIYSTEIKEELEESWEIHICSDAYLVADTVKYLQPEAMVLGLNMPHKDGLAILEECFPNIPPATIAISPLVNDYIAQTCASLGVRYLMPIPYKADEIKHRLEDIYAAIQNPPTAVARHLRFLGFNPSMDGYAYLLVALPYFAEDTGRHLGKEIYTQVVQVCGANDTQCVERSIRSAIKSAYKHGNKDAWAAYFPADENGEVKRPANKAFLKAVAERL